MSPNNKISADENFMAKAIQLAKRAIGSVEPNPPVGCVIVKNGEIIGQGFHQKFGEPHAEIQALADCKQKENNPENATMYVTLEPCCHYGKTPPCTKAIINAKIAKIYIAVKDESDKVNGKGIAQLKKADIKVETGICADKARGIIKPFLKWAKTKKCWVIAKWAQTADGKLAWKPKAKRRWISNEASRQNSQILRRKADAIVIGIETVLADDPLLTARPKGHKKLTKVVIDSKLRIPLDCNLIKMANKNRLLNELVIVTVTDDKKALAKLEKAGAKVLVVPETDGRCDLEKMVEKFSEMGLRQILIEGGPVILKAFIKQKIVDEFVVYVTEDTAGENGTGEVCGIIEMLEKTAELSAIEKQYLDGDIRWSAMAKT